MMKPSCLKAATKVLQSSETDKEKYQNKKWM